jgi:hypothetical protein
MLERTDLQISQLETMKVLLLRDAAVIFGRVFDSIDRLNSHKRMITVRKVISHLQK